MPSFTAEHQSEESPEFLFDLVADIESYPEFLPACRAAEILEEGEGYVVARLTILYGLIRESFVSHVRLDRKAGTIQATLKEGALKNLNCDWIFKPEDQGSHVRCALEFEFRSGLIAQIVAPLLHHVANRLVHSFIRRAQELASARQ